MRAFTRIRHSRLQRGSITMADPQLVPRKSPSQARSAATVAVILEAATRVLAAESLRGFNTNRVAAVAGVSVGSLYQYFPNKDALVAALIEHDHLRLAEAAELCVASSARRSLQQTVSALVTIAIDHQFGNAVLAAALDHEEQRLPLGGVLGQTRQRVAVALCTALKRHRTLLGVAPSMVVAADCITLAKALVESEAVNPRQNLAQLKRRVVRALLGYLQYRPSAVKASG
jgi:AcrR family transcriptional regulator